MSTKLIGKKARILGLLIMLSAALGFYNAGLQHTVAQKKLRYFVQYFSQKQPSSNEVTDPSTIKDYMKEHYQRGFDNFNSEQQENFKSTINAQSFTSSIYWYLCIFYGVIGLLVWAQKDIALKLFYLGIAMMISCQFLLNFFIHSTNAMSYGFSHGLVSQIVTTFLYSLASITMILNLLLLIIVPLMTDKVEQNVAEL